MSTVKKILVIRNDKIGDFMLAWPSFCLLKQQYPDIEITALVPEYTAALAKHCEWIDKVLIDNKEPSFLNDLSSLSGKIKDNNYDISISLFSELRTALSLRLALVKKRIGPATKFAQIFLNDRVKQKRSKSIKPEYEYNLDLIRYFIESNGDTPVAIRPAPYLTFDVTEATALKNKFTAAYPASKDTTLIFIHPGTGGSAINLSVDQYARLIQLLAETDNIYFIITAGPGEHDIAEQLSGMLGEIRHHVHYSDTGLIDFCKFINICDIFISGSTGPLHIAGALDKCTIAFYPSRRSATPLRWQTLNIPDKRLAFTNTGDSSENSYLIDLNAVIESIKAKYLY